MKNLGKKRLEYVVVGFLWFTWSDIAFFSSSIVDKWLKTPSNCNLKLGPMVFRLSLRVKFIGSSVFDAMK
jgi:hypothetical protein